MNTSTQFSISYSKVSRKTVILVIFGPNLGHETSNFGQKFDIFLKKKKLLKPQVVSRKLVKRRRWFQKKCYFTKCKYVFQKLDFL